MAKIRTQFVCQQCGYTSGKWLGRCPECENWNSFAEEIESLSSRDGGTRPPSGGVRPQPITAVTDHESPRIPMPLAELDRVLGGGLTRGSVVLLAGTPGIGKSTLLLQLLGNLAERSSKPLLYVSGEESARQIRLRANRLGAIAETLYLLTETELNVVLSSIEALTPEVVVVDSVQALYSPDLTSIPGSISQVREVADRLVRLAKRSETTVFLIGHVNKEGGIAGPMTLEHLVDTVLYFEGDRGQSYRILRAIKNRFGPTDEIGVFEMGEDGLKEVKNPSELFLRDRPQNTPGTTVFPALEGSRPLLVEIQGLATATSYGMPLRTSVGFDKNRLSMLLAVMEKRTGARLSDQDVYVNVVGGLYIREPAADLAVVAAVLSSLRCKLLPSDTVIFGEVGLAGEVRTVSRANARLHEAQKLGFSAAIVPPRCAESGSGFRCTAVGSLDQLLDLLC